MQLLVIRARVDLPRSTSVMDIGINYFLNLCSCLSQCDSFHCTFGVASLISTTTRMSVRRHGRLLVVVKNVGQLCTLWRRQIPERNWLNVHLLKQRTLRSWKKSRIGKSKQTIVPSSCFLFWSLTECAGVKAAATLIKCLTLHLIRLFVKVTRL